MLWKKEAATMDVVKMMKRTVDKFTSRRLKGGFLELSSGRSEGQKMNLPLSRQSRASGHQVKTIDSGLFTGLQIGDRIMLYSKDGTRKKENLRLDTTGTSDITRILIMDMDEGTWNVACNDQVGKVKVTKEGGFIFLTAEPGIYEISYEKQAAHLSLV